MKSDLIKNYAKVFDQYGLEYEYHESTEEIPYGYLQVDIGPDDELRDRYATVRAIEADEEPKGFLSDDAFISFIQISVVLPFEIKEGCMGETARILLFYNQGMNVPGFGMDEGSRRVYYRYSLPQKAEQIADEAIIGIVATILFYIETFSPSIEEVASGEPMKDVVKRSLQASLPEKP